MSIITRVKSTALRSKPKAHLTISVHFMLISPKAVFLGYNPTMHSLESAFAELSGV